MEQSSRILRGKDITDIETIMEMLSKNRKRALEQFERYMNELNKDKCLEYNEKVRLTDSEARTLFAEFGIMNMSDLQKQEKGKRDKIIRTIKAMNGITIRQLSRITGISKSVIDRA